MATPAQSSAAGAVKVAVTAVSAVMVGLQAAEPEQAPLQVSVAPLAGAAASATAVPSSNFAEQVPGQLMPAGVEVTVPEPATVTVSVCWVATGVSSSKSAKMG